MTDNSRTWAMIHAERSALADLLEDLTPAEWSTTTLCGGWSVKLLAAHILSGAEQTAPRFMRGMAGTGFRFNTLMTKDAHRFAALSPSETIQRLRARTTTTNHPPAPVMAMLGEVVVHGEDLRRPLGRSGPTDIEASRACLDMYRTASFPVGGRKRIRGLRLVATDADWCAGDGPEVAGSAASLLLAMTGREAGVEDLKGEGVPVLAGRLAGG